MLYLSHKNKLSKLRQSAGLTQAQLAEALGVAQSTINSWELGQRIPRAKSAQKIAEYFNVPIEEIFTPYKEEIKTFRITDAITKAQEECLRKEISEIISNFSLENLTDLKTYAEFLLLKQSQNKKRNELLKK